MQAEYCKLKSVNCKLQIREEVSRREPGVARAAPCPARSFNLQLSTCNLQFAIPSFLKRVYLWHLDGAVRYSTAVRVIKTHGNPKSSILEVGSGSVGITLFLPRPVTGYDVDFTGPDLGYLKQVRGSGDMPSLPFADASFDFVLAMDMLEHVPPEARAPMLRELVRVARSWLVVSVPCGAIAEDYDRRLHQWFQARLGTDHRWLREHFDVGLPEAGQIEAQIRQSVANGTSYDLAVEDNFNVGLWLWAWKFHMSRNRFWRSFKNKLLWPLRNWFSRHNGPPAYRKAFVLHKRPTA
jgi:hypothetical protein